MLQLVSRVKWLDKKCKVEVFHSMVERPKKYSVVFSFRGRGESGNKLIVRQTIGEKMRNKMRTNNGAVFCVFKGANWKIR